jgi:hypothetical protein
MTSPTLFAPHFMGDSWDAWRVVLRALFALSMSDKERDVFAKHTGVSPPKQQAREAYLIVGRRGGKSRIAALIAVFLAAFREYKLAIGERGVLMVLAADRRQAGNVFGYIEGLIDSTPPLAAMVVGRTRESIDLNNGIAIEVHVSNYRSVRGYTVVGAICDEIAFWYSEDSANPDSEVVNAIHPAMSTVPGSMLIAISSPYARRGLLWRQYTKHYGKPDAPVLVWQAPTLAMNPSASREEIDAAYERDEAPASAEFGAEFRKDVEAFISREVVEACTVPDRIELPPITSQRYLAFCDPSGGSNDSFAIAIAHHERRSGVEIIVVDAVRERRPPFSPEVVVHEFADLLHSYRVGTVQGDRYAGEFVAEAFRRCGIAYKPSERVKSQIYGDALALLNSKRVELLDHPRLINQLCSLERRTARGGRDSIDHGPNQHDDVANAVAGALVAAGSRRRNLCGFGWGPRETGGGPDNMYLPANGHCASPEARRKHSERSTPPSWSPLIKSSTVMFPPMSTACSSVGRPRIFCSSS